MRQNERESEETQHSNISGKEKKTERKRVKRERESEETQNSNTWRKIWLRLQTLREREKDRDRYKEREIERQR